MKNAFNLSAPIEWWRGAVIYQIYPRSLLDTNGTGVGDLRGITKKLDYVASLGVDAVWISPFFQSPMEDFGYDISDYRQVSPLFGSSDDFSELINRAHALNLKVMIDQVISHTSDQHAWFIESRQSTTNPKSDWYVWADSPHIDKPPNNWLSIFGGSAWQWDTGRQQYYLHNFLRSQPDLNYHCSEVRAQILSEIEFWLAQGVDGLRLDAINYCYHDAHLRNNPEKPVGERTGRGFSSDNPYAAQYHIYDNTQPENLEFLEELRALLDRYPGTAALGEINSENSLATMADYTQANDRLHMGYSFELLGDEFSACHIRKTVEAFEQHVSDGWPCWALSNHDVIRVVSRWGMDLVDDSNTDALAKLLTVLLGTLRGTICTYQGEELGLTQAHIEQHQLQDPFGIEFWPDFKGRDGCRTPMPWVSDDPFGGFSEATPWLPIPPEHLYRSVADQLQNKESVLSFYRQFHHWRSTQAALKYGNISFPDVIAERELLTIERTYGDALIRGYFNLENGTQTVTLPDGMRVLEHAPSQGCRTNKPGSQLTLEPFGFTYVVINEAPAF